MEIIQILIAIFLVIGLPVGATILAINSYNKLQTEKMNDLIKELDSASPSAVVAITRRSV